MPEIDSCGFGRLRIKRIGRIDQRTETLPCGAGEHLRLQALSSNGAPGRANDFRDGPAWNSTNESVNGADPSGQKNLFRLYPLRKRGGNPARQLSFYLRADEAGTEHI